MWRVVLLVALAAAPTVVAHHDGRPAGPLWQAEDDPVSTAGIVARKAGENQTAILAAYGVDAAEGAATQDPVGDQVYAAYIDAWRHARAGIEGAFETARYAAGTAGQSARLVNDSEDLTLAAFATASEGARGVADPWAWWAAHTPFPYGEALVAWTGGTSDGARAAAFSFAGRALELAIWHNEPVACYLGSTATCGWESAKCLAVAPATARSGAAPDPAACIPRAPPNCAPSSAPERCRAHAPEAPSVTAPPMPEAPPL